jgi:hypothetical protein
VGGGGLRASERSSSSNSEVEIEVRSVERVVTGERPVWSMEAVLGLAAGVVMESVEVLVKMRLTGSKEKDEKENLLMDGMDMED